MEKVSLEIFKSNDKGRKIEDVISNLCIGKTKEGITILHFHTTEKYHYVEQDGSGINSVYISIHPILYSGESVLANELRDNDFDEYINHPDYYWIQLKVLVPDCQVIVMPLKHQYQVNIIPNTMLFGNVDYEPVKLGDAVWKL